MWLQRECVPRNLLFFFKKRFEEIGFRCRRLAKTTKTAKSHLPNSGIRVSANFTIMLTTVSPVTMLSDALNGLTSITMDTHLAILASVAAEWPFPVAKAPSPHRPPTSLSPSLTWTTWIGEAVATQRATFLHLGTASTPFTAILKWKRHL